MGQMPIFKHFNFVHTNPVVLQNGLDLGLSYPEKNVSQDTDLQKQFD